MSYRFNPPRQSNGSSSHKTSANRNSRRKISAAARMETLESRTLMSVTPALLPHQPIVLPNPIIFPPRTIVAGTAGNDVIDVFSDANPANVTVTVNGTVAFDAPWTKINWGNLIINGNGGNDTVNVGMGNLQNFAGNVTVENTGTSGHFTLNISDASDTTGRSVTQMAGATQSTITGLFPHTIYYTQAQTTAANLLTGAGADSVMIESTAAPFNLNTSGGHDIVYVCSSNGLENINGAVCIQNTPSFDNVYISDINDPGARTVTQTSVNGYDVITGWSPAPISYKFNDVTTVGLTTGSGNTVVGQGYGNQQIYCGNGADEIYGSTNGSDSIWGGAGNDTFVTVGDGAVHFYGGGGINTYWIDSGGSQVISDANYAFENAIGNVHAIANFTNLVVHHANGTTTTQAVGLAGNWNSSLLEPDDAGQSYQSFSSHPLFGAGGPSQNDVNQRAAADCYFLSGLAGVAKTDPHQIQESVVELGDGSYAVRFYKSGTTPVYYRVNAELPVNSSGTPAYATFGASGALWVSLLEKAFTFFRSGKGTYASIDYGGLNEPFSALGDTSSSFWGANDIAVLDSIAADLNNGQAVTAATVGAPTAAANVVGNHAYTVESVQFKTVHILGLTLTVPYSITVRNPWGYNGANSGSNSDGGYGTLSAADFYSDFYSAQAASV